MVTKMGSLISDFQLFDNQNKNSQSIFNRLAGGYFFSSHNLCQLKSISLSYIKTRLITII